MIVTLAKYQPKSTIASPNKASNRVGWSGVVCFNMYIPNLIADYLGKSVVVNKTSFGYTLRSAMLDDNSNLYTIHKGNLAFSGKNVNEFEDLGDYEVDPDYENEIVNLVKL